MKVSANLAISLDGRIGLPNIKDRFASRKDLLRMKELRRNVDAVLVGGRTFCDWPLPYDSGQPILNAVLTASGIGTALPSSLRKWQDAQVQLMVMTSDATAMSPDMQHHGLQVLTCQTPSLQWALTSLEERGVKHVLCEGGGKMLIDLIRIKRLNRLFLTICPKLFGTGPSLLDGAIENVQLSLVELERFESEIFTAYDLVYLPEA